MLFRSLFESHSKLVQTAELRVLEFEFIHNALIRTVIQIVIDGARIVSHTSKPEQVFDIYNFPKSNPCHPQGWGMSIGARNPPSARTYSAGIFEAIGGR